MKKAICLISLLYLFPGCASAPEGRAPAGNSYEKLLRAKELRCLSSESASSSVTDEGELISRDNPLEEDVDTLPWRISIRPLPGSDRATIHLDIEGHEDPGIPLTYTSVARRWDEGMSFFTELGELGIATITVFDNRRYHIFSQPTDDIMSDYGAILSSHIKLFGVFNLNVFGFCEAVE